MRYRCINRFVLLLALLFVGGFSNASENLLFKKGVLDLRGHNIRQLDNIGFNGEWEFHWNQLLYPYDFANKEFEVTSYVKVPSAWDVFEINGKNIPATGFATYRALILKDISECKMSLRLGAIESAFVLFIDGVELRSGGLVSENENDGIPGYNPGVVDFISNSDTIEVIIQVSNYHSAKGGIVNGFCKLGKSENVNKAWNGKTRFTVLLLGIMLIIAFYNTIIFYLNRKFIYTLFFSLFCLVIITYTLVVDEIFVLYIFPDFNWSAILKMRSLARVIGNITFVLFIYNFFKDDHSRKFMFFIVIVDALFVLLIATTSPSIFAKYVLLFQLFILLSLVYSSIIVVRALVRKSMSAVIMAIGFLILMITVINDIFYINNTFNTIHMSSTGLVVFILSQAYMMSRHFSSLYHETNDLAEELKSTNVNLGGIVDKRTSEIQDQNRFMQNQQSVILSKNSELSKYNDEIKHQRDNYKELHKLVNKQKKEITSSIEYASRIQGAVLGTANEFNIEGLDSFTIFHPKDIISGDFHWFKEVNINGNSIKLIAVVDCTGHGVPGAFMSMLGTLLLNSVVDEFSAETKASDILNTMRSEFENLLHRHSSTNAVADGMDMALAIVDYDNMKLQFAGAHNSICFIRNVNSKLSSEIEEYKGDGMSIGKSVGVKVPFVNHIVDISKGDLFYLFTKGFCDQFGGENKKRLTSTSFKKMLLSGAHLSLANQKIRLDNNLLIWRGNYEQVDDITVIGVRI